MFLHRSGPRFFSTVRFLTIWATCTIFLGKSFTAPPPPRQIFPYAYANFSNKLQVKDIPGRRKTLILRAPPRIFIEAKRISSYLSIIIISSSFIPHNYFFPWKNTSNNAKIPGTNAEATPGHSDVPKLQLCNVPELHESLTSRSAEVIKSKPRVTLQHSSKWINSQSVGLTRLYRERVNFFGDIILIRLSKIERSAVSFYLFTSVEVLFAWRKLNLGCC